MYVRNERGLATWAKWLIGIMATILVLGLATCGILGFATYNTFKDVMNPEKAKELAVEMVTITDPLPAPYEYKAGMNMFDTVTFVTIINSENNYYYTLVKMVNNDKTGLSAEDMVEQLATQGVPTGSGGGTTKIKVEEKGSMEIAGAKVPYVLGKTQNKGKLVPSLMGVVVPDQSHVIMIIAMGPEGADKIDVEQTKKFFANISAFK